MHRTSARLGAARWALAPDTGSLPWPRLRPTQPHVDWTACFLGCSEPWAPAFTSSSTPSVLSGVIPSSRLMLFIYPSVRLSSMGISCLSTYRPLLSPTYLPPTPTHLSSTTYYPSVYLSSVTHPAPPPWGTILFLFSLLQEVSWDDLSLFFSHIYCKQAPVSTMPGNNSCQDSR